MNELEEIINFISKDIMSLPVEEQMIVINAMMEMASKVKPIYIKHKIKSGDKFIARL